MNLCHGELSEPSFVVRADSVNTLDVKAWYAHNAAAMNAEEQRQTTPLRKHPKKLKKLKGESRGEGGEEGQRMKPDNLSQWHQTTTTTR